MFIGHYAAGFALKSVENKASLGLLFIAVQFIDVLFFPLTLAGIEKFRLIENYTASTHFELSFMPYSHSLVAVLCWSLLFAVLARMSSKTTANPVKIGLVVALAVLSHWLLDLIVHTEDLPLMSDDSPKLGFGLWHYALLTYLLEAVSIIGGLILYMRSTQSISTTGKYGMPIFVMLLLAINVLNIFGPLSADDTIETTAVSALIAYVVFAAIAFWLDRHRVASVSQPERSLKAA